ncbi:unnamed protein product [Clonostachys byssicola]|uniref:SMP-30/Gluconolactonase/LRE-like region domain-containing protein n=1 Tax=Clonostachys byssicola TaxID=160290 RepID=A0A9N9UL60_9HYPO|nr:unnamed protein product [Clonostachys byssicola]
MVATSLVTAFVVQCAFLYYSGGLKALNPFSLLSSSTDTNSNMDLSSISLPAQAQWMLPASTLFIPPGTTLESLLEKPFHVHHQDFLDIIGLNPTLTKIADSGTNPMFHEAPVWHPPTDEVFFCQNAGAKAAGTGLNRSSVIQKVSVPEAVSVSHLRDATGQVKVEVVPFDPPVINPNGGTNYQGNFIFAGEGQGSRVPPALYLANPVAPYNTTQIVNNYYGRQFNSVNDVAVNPANGDIYFTDVTYGYLQDFRPEPVLPNQAYRLNAITKALTAVADDQINPNGITFSPDGRYAYITETGASMAFQGYFQSRPAGIYRFTVAPDGTFENRKLFAHVTVRIADGIHCDDKGNVYAGCGDGVNVWNPSGVLLGKIFTGRTAANFQFAGDGRMIIMGATNLYFATLGAKGAELSW